MNEIAEQTLDVTAQLKNRDSYSTLFCCFSMNSCIYRYKRLDSLSYTDTFNSKKVVSKRGFSIMQIFVSDKGFVKVYRMKSEKEFVKYFKLFFKEVGAPKAFIVYPHPSHKSNEVQTLLKKVSTTLQALEESTQYSDRAEVYIGIMKTSVGEDMQKTNSPMLLWCYTCERRAALIDLNANNPFQLLGQNPYMKNFVDMGDISNLFQFG